MIRRTKLVSYVTIVALVIAWKSAGGIGSYEGGDRQFWESHSLIIGRVASMPEKNSVTNVTTLHLEVLSVVWTDQIVRHEVTIQYYAGMLGALSSQPDIAKDQVVLACVSKVDGKWGIQPDYITFMPKSAGLWVMKSEDDSALQPLLDKIDKIRHAAIRGEKSPILTNMPTTAH